MLKTPTPEQIDQARKQFKSGKVPGKSTWYDWYARFSDDGSKIPLTHFYKLATGISSEDHDAIKVALAPVDVDVVNTNTGSSYFTAPRTSHFLRTGAVYTRADLQAAFEIQDASLRNGIFKPKQHSSVWIFVTEEKSADRTQYADHLEGDTLQMEGQTEGRTDRLISNHVKAGNELVVFHRKNRNEHPGAGFVYQGRFYYISQSGSKPTSFELRRIQQLGSSDFTVPAPNDETEIAIQAESQLAAVARQYDPKDEVDARVKTLASIARRRGQPAFRRALLRAYKGRCAITGCGLERVLEAAHVHRYLGPSTNVPSNGLLLRADIHTLFDLLLISVDPPTGKVLASPELAGTEYASLEGVQIAIPDSASDQVSPKALEWHRNQCKW